MQTAARKGRPLLQRLFLTNAAVLVIAALLLILTPVTISAPVTLEQMIAAREPARLLVFCDEDAEVKDPIAALHTARPRTQSPMPPVAVLIGPEGGFAEEERAALLKLTNVVRLSLGPRILRADTAAVAALALIQAVLGDAR